MSPSHSKARSRYVCPVCGAEMLSPATLCSGSFLDRDHPANVQPIVASPPIVRGPQAMGDGGPCMSCGGNDGYGPAPHHTPDCYFASAEDAGEVAR